MSLAAKIVLWLAVFAAFLACVFGGAYIHTIPAETWWREPLLTVVVYAGIASWLVVVLFGLHVGGLVLDEVLE